MAGNSLVGFFWRELMTDGGAEEEAWLYLAVCVPVVVVFAPVGSFLASHFHRWVVDKVSHFFPFLHLTTLRIGTFQLLLWKLTLLDKLLFPLCL